MIAGEWGTQGLGRTPVDEDLVVQMRTGRTARSTRAADRRPGSDRLPRSHVDLGKVPAEAADLPPMIEDDRSAIAAAPAGKNDGAVGRRLDRSAAAGPDVDARVKVLA